jgi:glycosyltransferase involved in cell wall biosynthesis
VTIALALTLGCRDAAADGRWRRASLGAGSIGRTTVAIRASVVICAYTEERFTDLERAVASALEQTVAPLEVVVAIDNNAALLERAHGGLHGASVVANAHAAGLAGARNSGAAQTTAPVIAFLDDDAHAARDWLERLLERYDDAAVLGAGGRIEPRWRTARPRWFPEEFDWVVGCSYRGLPVQTARVRNMIGANMSVRRDVLEAIGGFREDLGRLPSGAGAAEETDFCIRGSARFPDGHWLYVPAASVSHVVGAERTSWAYFRRRCLNEGLAKAAMVAGGAGSHGGLRSERAYVRSVLPRGVARGLLAALRGDRAGPLRSMAIVAGLAYTTLGYLRGRATSGGTP